MHRSEVSYKIFCYVFILHGVHYWDYKCPCLLYFFLIEALCCFTGVVVIIILANAIAFLLLVLGAIVLNKKLKARKARNLKEKNFKKNHGLLLQQLVDKDISEKMLFSLDKLEKATNNFDEIRKIGRGGHGTVYKGILLNQQVVVVKKSNLTVQSEIDGFINEVAVLSTINHRNIIQLVGCCLAQCWSTSLFQTGHSHNIFMLRVLKR